MRNSIWSFVVVEVERSSDGGMVVRNWGGAASLIDVRTRMRAGMRYVAECGEGRIERAEPSSRRKMILEHHMSTAYTPIYTNVHPNDPPIKTMSVSHTLWRPSHPDLFLFKKERKKDSFLDHLKRGPLFYGQSRFSSLESSYHLVFLRRDT